MGEAIAGHRSLVYTEIRKSTGFDQTVDLSSLLPILTIPLMADERDEDSEVFGVLQLVIKQRHKVK